MKKQEIKFELVKTYKRGFRKSAQRIYKTNKKLFKGCNPDFNIKEEVKDTTSRLVESYKWLEKVMPKDYYDHIIISDAHTHTERLAFAGFSFVENEEAKFYMYLQSIDGIHTLMTEGGNRKDVYPDEVYLRRIAKVNGYQFKN